MSRLVLLRVATRPLASLSPFAAPEWAAAERAVGALQAELRDERSGLEALLFETAGPPGRGDAGERHAVLAILRALHNGRAPRERDLAEAGERLGSPLRERLASHARSLQRVQELERRAASLLDEAAHAARRAIASAWADPLVRGGIASASVELAAKLDRVAASPGKADRHGERHVEAKALAYLARFATKTSPNGVFCATSLGRIAGDACVVTGTPGIDRVEVLVSIAEARKIACTLAFDPAVEAAVVPRVNPTLREDSEGYSFWRPASARHADDHESLSRVRPHPIVGAFLEEAGGGRSLPELRRRVAARVEVEEDLLAPFLRRLIETGLLIAEIEIPYAERRPLRYVATRARGAGCEAPWIAPALAIEDAVDAASALPAGERPAALARIAEDLERLPRSRPLRHDELFRTDAVASAQVTLPAAILDELQGAVADYARLFAAMYPAASYRAGWVRRFLAKFPAGEDVDLLDVYRVLTEQAETYRPAAFPEPEAEERAARGVMEAARDTVAGREEPTLSEILESAGLTSAPEPRWAAGVLFQIAAGDAAAIGRGAYRVILNGLFQGAGLSLSRFASLLGAEPVTAELRRAWSVIEREGAVVAELTYNHLGRTANAGLRPSIFSHEIELPGDTASPGAEKLALSSLTVRWDAEAGRFVLRKKGEGTEVIPVINSGVNPVGFISFLVAIGEQELQPIGYFPGFDRPDVIRWPRVTAGRVLVFRERWVFRREAWPEPSTRGFVRWRESHRLPRHVFAHSSLEPKPRYLDLESPAFLDLLRRDLTAWARDPAATLELTEMLPGPGDLWLEGHPSEFLVQMSSLG